MKKVLPKAWLKLATLSVLGENVLSFKVPTV